MSPSPSPALRWISYCRVSTDEQASEGVSLDAQAAACRAYAQAKGWLLAEEIQDAGASAATMKRAGMQRVLAELQAGAGVVVYRLDRLTRSLRDLLDLVALAGDRGGLVSVSESLDTTNPMGRFTIHLLGALAQWERETISHRVKGAMQHARGEGFYVGGGVPAGLGLVSEGARKRLVRGKYADAVAPIWGMVLRGASLSDVGATLRAAGVPGQWTKNRVRGLLLATYCTGLLVDKGTQEAVRSTLAKRPGLPGRPPAGEARALPASPVAGIARCPACGATLIQVSARGRGGRYRYLRCVGRAKGVCTAKDRRAEPVEAGIAVAVSHALRGGDYTRAWVSTLRGETQRAEGLAAERGRLTVERDQTRARAEELSLSGPRPSDPAFWVAMRPLTDRLTVIESRLAEIEGKLAASEGQGLSAEEILSRLELAGAGLAEAAPERQRLVYDGVLAAATVHEDRVELRLFPPDETSTPPERGGGSFQSRLWLGSRPIPTNRSRIKGRLCRMIRLDVPRRSGSLARCAVPAREGSKA